jgi:glucose dehydrogenase
MIGSASLEHKGHKGHKGNATTHFSFVSFVSLVLTVAPVLAQVSSSRLATNATDAGNWLMYSGAYTSQRFSPLDQISSTNVSRLKPLWVYQPPGVGSLEGTPVVADGVMYVTSAPASVVALDLRSGRPIWEWSRLRRRC